MKNKIYELYKKYKFIIIILLCIIIVSIGIIIFFSFESTPIKEFKNDYYSFIYDNSWNIYEKKDKEITLKHSSESSLHIEIIDLEDDYKYLSIEDILDELLYDIEKQNTKFKLISKNKDSITKNQYDGYKMLYENDHTQAMVVVYKKSDKLIIFTYESTNDYFDILLDSVHNIIYYFDTVEQSFELSHHLNLEESQIKYESSNTVTFLLDKTKQDEIAYNNYHVKYTIPNNFETNGLNSTNAYYVFKELKDGDITMSINIRNVNIYEMLDHEEKSNIYSKWNYYQNNEDYSNFQESIMKFKSDYESYIYKNSYYYDKSFTYDEYLNTNYTSEIRENIMLLYALDKNHVLIIEISSSKVSIPKELIDMIKIDSSENYSSFITSTKNDSYIISNLKRFTNSTNKTVEEITLKIPSRYKEIDKNKNIYESRYYNLDYNEKMDVYNYEIEYSLTGTHDKIDDQLKLIHIYFKTSYGNPKYLNYSGDQIINNKKFQIYDGGYTDISGIMFTTTNRIKYYVNIKVLFYELKNGGFLVIKIQGNGTEISDELLNELTNFEIK